jgi:hypothetical protein
MREIWTTQVLFFIKPVLGYPTLLPGFYPSNHLFFGKLLIFWM